MFIRAEIESGNRRTYFFLKGNLSNAILLPDGIEALNTLQNISAMLIDIPLYTASCKHIDVENHHSPPSRGWIYSHFAHSYAIIIS